MQLPETVRPPIPTELELRTWDWLAELKRQDRNLAWLARKTGAHYRSVYRWARGERVVPLGWLIQVARILGQ
jgi:hypothetical protein